MLISQKTYDGRIITPTVLHKVTHVARILEIVDGDDWETANDSAEIDNFEHAKAS